MRRLILRLLALGSIILALVVILGAGLPSRSSALNLFRVGETPVAPEVGALAPQIDTQDVRGDLVTLSKWRGQPVIVNFWATWCTPCLTEMPLLQATAARYQAQGLRMVGISIDDTVADTLTWAARLGLTYPLIADREGRFGWLYIVRTLPATYFIGRDGVIKQITVGALSDADLANGLNAIMP